MKKRLFLIASLLALTTLASCNNNTVITSDNQKESVQAKTSESTKSNTKTFESKVEKLFSGKNVIKTSYQTNIGIETNSTTSSMTISGEEIADLKNNYYKTTTNIYGLGSPISQSQAFVVRNGYLFQFVYQWGDLTYISSVTKLTNSPVKYSDVSNYTNFANYEKTLMGIEVSIPITKIFSSKDLADLKNAGISIKSNQKIKATYEIDGNDLKMKTNNFKIDINQGDVKSIIITSSATITPSNIYQIPEELKNYDGGVVSDTDQLKTKVYNVGDKVYFPNNYVHYFQLNVAKDSLVTFENVSSMSIEKVNHTDIYESIHENNTYKYNLTKGKYIVYVNVDNGNEYVTIK